MGRWAQLMFREHGKTYKMAMSRLVQARAVAFNMQQVVVNYLREIAGGREIKYVLDVGGCYGAFAVPFTVMFPDADILSLEPSSENYPYLEFNTKDIPQIEIRKIAAHNEKTRVRIAAPTTVQRNEPEDDLDSGLISVHGRSAKFAEMVDADTLDNIVTRPVDWLKIDVEGHETAVLEGAERILTEDRPILQVEMREDNQRMANETSSKLVVAISEKGYSIRGSLMGDFIFSPDDR